MIYDSKWHSKQFIHDAIEFNDIMMSMLSEYSKGKVLTIQTQRKRKVKKTKKGNLQDDDDDQFEEDDQGHLGLQDELSIDEESDCEEKFVERQFNFVSEISTFVDYKVIGQYLKVLKNKDYFKNHKLLAQVKTLFQRIVHQIKAAWIFFQFDFMLVLQEFLNKGHVTNALMKGIPTG